MELKMVGNSGDSAGTVKATDDIFGREFNEALVHQQLTNGVVIIRPM